MNAIEAMKTRVSIRKYKKQVILKEILIDLVDCAHMAPSGYNHQPWTFLVITDEEILKRVAKVAQSGQFIMNAGACIMVFCKKGVETALEDACAATENIITAASCYGLGTCWVNTFQKSQSHDIKCAVNCPQELELMTMLAVGYPDEEKVTNKKSLSEVLQWDTF